LRRDRLPNTDTDQQGKDRTGGLNVASHFIWKHNANQFEKVFTFEQTQAGLKVEDAPRVRPLRGFTVKLQL
jgi:hypothetical protein